MAKVMIGIPAFDTVSTSFFSSVLAQRYYSGFQYSYAIEAGSMVYDARGRIAQRAINSGADWLLMYDSDMVFSPETTQMLLDTAMGDMPYPDKGGVAKDFVTGLYFMRRLPTKPLILKELDWYEDETLGAQEVAEEYEDYPRNSVFEIAGCGFGCCVIRVGMLPEVVAAFRISPFTPQPRLSEDLSFCWRLKVIKKQMLADPTILPGHAGLKVYSLSDWDNQLKEG